MSFCWDCNRNNNLIVTVLAVTVPTKEEIILVVLILPSSTPFNAHKDLNTRLNSGDKDVAAHTTVIFLVPRCQGNI